MPMSFHLNPEFDRQTQLASRVYAEHTDSIDADIIQAVDTYMKSGFNHEDQRAYELLYTDGMWSPWNLVKSPIADEYFDYIGQHGNTGQEEMYLSSVWCHVLLNKTTDPAPYLPYVQKFLDIQANGL